MSGNVSKDGIQADLTWMKRIGVGGFQNFDAVLKKGTNTLEVKVTNLWVNRIIGDMQPGVENKLNYTTMDFYQANFPLQASGLLGR